MLNEKTAVITGGADGIGAAVALAFARQGVSAIMIGDIDFSKAKETSSRISRETGCNCLACAVDVGNRSDIEQMFQQVRTSFGRLDILVNCAGVCPTGTIEEIDEDHWDKVMAINLKGTYLCCREALMLMKPEHYGKIINVSSISGRIGGIATGINYSTSKGGIIAMTMALAKAAGPYNINVNAVAPGFINTRIARQFTHFTPDSVPLKRIGEPEDVADVIVFLASEMSRYITGCTIDINGGLYMG
jgi:3-oxoacyl-[acyl-carrier protein] reductase